jgi:type IV pilus assembly protein PilV
METRTPERSRKRTSRNRGLTLVEVMIALVILAFGLLGVAAIQIKAITGGSQGQHLSQASNVARNRIELLSRLGWDDATLTDTGGAWKVETDSTDMGVEYRTTERVTNSGTELKQIEVRVQWDDGLRTDRTLQLSGVRLREIDE